MNSNRLTFDFKNSIELFENLLEEFEDFKKDSTKSRFAMNCVINTWHLTDWTYHEYFNNDLRFQEHIKVDKNGCKEVISGLLKYQDFVIKSCPEMKYMRLITNGVKHFRLRNPNINANTIHHTGEFSNEFTREFNVSRFIIVVGDNEYLDFYQTLEETIRYWAGILNRNVKT